jgi:hypothetical protein
MRRTAVVAATTLAGLALATPPVFAAADSPTHAATVEEFFPCFYSGSQTEFGLGCRASHRDPVRSGPGGLYTPAPVARGAGQPAAPARPRCPTGSVTSVTELRTPRSAPPEHWRPVMRCRSRTFSLAALTVAALAVTPAAHAAARSDGGCAAFGANVSGLATTLGPVFGATASGVAASAPGAFPDLVVHAEQDALCG